MVLIEVDPLVRKWSKKIDLKMVANAVANVTGIKTNLGFRPIWSYGSSATEKVNGLNIYVEPALSFDLSCSADTLYKRNFYLIGHEITHPQVSKNSIAELFRHDVLARAYHIDFTPEGLEHSAEMALDDNKIDSKLFTQHQDFLKGFFEMHAVGCLDDAPKIEYFKRRIKKSGFNLDAWEAREFLFYLLRVQRRTPLAEFAKKERMLAGKYHNLCNQMIFQHHTHLKGALRKLYLRNLADELKGVFEKTIQTKKRPLKKSLKLLRQFETELCSF